VALGLAGGFLEPARVDQHSIWLNPALAVLIELFPARGFEPRLAEEYNRLMARSYESHTGISSFLHYHASRRSGELWRYCQSMSIPDGLHYQNRIVKAQGVVTLHDRGSFAEPSWVYDLFRPWNLSSPS